jgi:hypothetical protein
MTNTVYNSLKWIALVFLPAAGALYFGLGQLWAFPKIEEVVGSVTVVETFLGLLLRKSAVDFGTAKTVGDAIVVQNSEGVAVGMKFTVDASADPVILEEKKVVQFAVKREQITDS